MTKMTERDFLNAMIANYDRANVANADQIDEYITNRLEKLDQRNANRKPTKKQQANEELRKTIVAAMEPDKSYTVTDLTKLPEIADQALSVSKVSAIIQPITMMNDDCSIEEYPLMRTVIKGKAYYTKR